MKQGIDLKQLLLIADKSLFTHVLNGKYTLRQFKTRVIEKMNNN